MVFNGDLIELNCNSMAISLDWIGIEWCFDGDFMVRLDLRVILLD